MTWRTESLARVPWITRLDEGERCISYRWLDIPRKHVRTPERERYRCRRIGLWRFDALPRIDPSDIRESVATSGIYCWNHLLSQLSYSDREIARFEAWQRQNVELIRRIQSGQEPKFIKERSHSARYRADD